MRHRLRSAVFPIAMAALVLSACGVQPQENANAIPSNVIPAPLRVPAPPSSPSATVPSQDAATPPPTASRLRLWFVQDDGLAAAESSLPAGSPPELVMQALAIGPDPSQVDQGLRTIAGDPLTGLALANAADPAPTPSSQGPATSTASPGPAPVVVRLSAAFSALPPAEQVLLLGQVVLSLSGSGVRSVAFTDDAGAPLAVPLPDGRLLDVPATARDYASLIVQP